MWATIEKMAIPDRKQISIEPVARVFVSLMRLADPSLPLDLRFDLLHIEASRRKKSEW